MNKEQAQSCPGCKDCRTHAKPKVYEYPHEQIDYLETQLAAPCTPEHACADCKAGRRG